MCRKTNLDFQGLKILICVCDMSLVAAQEAVPIRKQYVLYGEIFQNAKLKVLWCAEYMWNYSYLNCGYRWKWRMLPTCGFIAQLVEHRTGIAEVTSSNPVEALIFQASFSNYLDWRNLLRRSFFTLRSSIKAAEVLERYLASSVNLKTITGVKRGKLASLCTWKYLLGLTRH